ncbi:MAG: hypothetical protein ACF8CQ_07470, partial [Rhodopirellula sp. JB044]|uniref:hypothetical protein n=1 Tax=Rhodopirellula sp. JB044 TaxID=3342844 RepID=UPI00370A10EF
PIVPMPDPDAEQKIFDALQGKTPNAPPGVLSDVLDVIRSQGSVLDGSSLDAGSDDPLGIDITENPANRRGQHPDVNQTTRTRSAFVQTAESLLKTSRMLEKLVPLMRVSKDETKQTPAADSSLKSPEQPHRTEQTHRSEQTQAVNELIYRMRLQATRLLLQQYPEATER